MFLYKHRNDDSVELNYVLALIANFSFCKDMLFLITIKVNGGGNELFL